MKRTKDLWIGNSKVLQTSKSQSILEGVIRCVSQDKNERIETTPKKVNHILNTPNIYKLLDKSPMYHNKMKRLKIFLTFILTLVCLITIAAIPVNAASKPLDEIQDCTITVNMRPMVMVPAQIRKN